MNASRKVSELEKFIEARLGDMGFELVEINHLGQYGRQVLELYCDRMDDDAISVGNCAEISKRLKHTLEAEGFFKDDFSLVVSSPGLDRVVRRPEDFVKFMGRRVRVLRAEGSGSKSVTGELKGYDDGNLTLVLEDGEELVVSRDDYRLVRLVPEIKGFDKKGKKKAHGAKR